MDLTKETLLANLMKIGNCPIHQKIKYLIKYKIKIMAKQIKK
jgi:hypothetical protein